jgi:hypothetical protein
LASVSRVPTFVLTSVSSLFTLVMTSVSRVYLDLDLVSRVLPRALNSISKELLFDIDLFLKYFFTFGLDLCLKCGDKDPQPLLLLGGHCCGEGCYC